MTNSSNLFIFFSRFNDLKFFFNKYFNWKLIILRIIEYFCFSVRTVLVLKIWYRIAAHTFSKLCLP